MKKLLLLTLLLVGVALSWWALRDTGEGGSSAPPVRHAGGVDAGAPEQGLPSVAGPPAQERAPVFVPDLVPQEGTLLPPANEQEGHNARILVTVVAKETGNPLSGVRLLLSKSNPGSGSFSIEHIEGNEGGIGRAPITGDDGQATLSAPPKVALELDVGDDEDRVGRVAVPISPLRSGELREMVVRLPTEADLAFVGRVVSAENGVPVEGAQIHFQLHKRFSIDDVWQETTETQLTITTDHEGFFRATLPSWKGLIGRVAADGFGILFFEPKKEHDSRDRALVLRAARSASLHGRVTDESGVGVDALTISVGASYSGLVQGRDGFMGAMGSDPSWTTRTKHDGLWSILDLPANVRLQVRLMDRGRDLRHEANRRVLKPGEDGELNWRIGSGTTIRGRVVVVEDGQPLRRHEIWLLPAEQHPGRFLESYEDPTAKTRTDRDGHFTFNDVAPGKWIVGPEPKRSDWDPPSDRYVAPVCVLVEVLDGAGECQVLLEVHRGLYIRGVVQGPSGDRAVGAFVLGFNREDGLFISTESQEDGSFTIGPLIPGRYKLHASGVDDNLSESDPVTALAEDEGVLLQLTAGGSISGRVMNAVTREPLSAKITVASQGPDGDGWMMTGTRDDGRFHFGGLAPGTYSVFARTGGLAGLLEGVLVSPGLMASDLVVALEPAAAVLVEYDGSEDMVLIEVISASGARIVSEPFFSGKNQRHELPPGRVTVKARAFAEEALVDISEQTVELVAGEETKVVLSDS